MGPSGIWISLRHVFQICSLALWLVARADARNCYRANGTLAPEDAPCFPENPHSACCGGSIYLCATNNMCANPDGSYYVIGTCTDPTWNHPACPNYCHSRDVPANTATRCGTDTYCCGDDFKTCNCTTGEDTVKIRDVLPPFSELVGSSASLFTTAITSSLFTPSGAIIPPATISAVVTETPFEPAPLATSRTFKTDETQHNTSIEVGLGVGIPFGVISLILAVILLWLRMRSKQRRAESYMDPRSRKNGKVPIVEAMGSIPCTPVSTPVTTPKNYFHGRSAPATRCPTIYEAPGDSIYSV